MDTLSPVTWKLAGAVVLLTLAAVSTPRTALANGDLPSAVLTGQDVYVPANPATRRSVRDLTVAARKAMLAGYPAKVAVVQSQRDLGTVSLLDKPQEYANYLANDLRRHPGTPEDFALLVVTPVGAGIAGKSFDDDEREAARRIEVRGGASSDELVRAAQHTLERMAAASGHPIGGAGGPGNRDSSGALVIGVLGGLILLTLLAALARRTRERAAREGPG